MTEEPKSQLKYSPPNYTSIDRIALERRLPCPSIRTLVRQLRPD